MPETRPLLARIALGLFQMGRDIERAQNVARVLEVNHKMHLERESLDGGNVWIAIADAFGIPSAAPDEAVLYAELVASRSGLHSVARCVAVAREQGRTLRDHISEEMWLHLNRFHLGFASVGFAEVVQRGRSEFNRDVETFCDAFFGLADSTMIHAAPWHFLRIGRFLERAAMICRILEIKRKSLSLAPGAEGRPLDVHQWQGLLRSVSGYEPYRRVYDARIAPERVVDFVLKSPDFPRSLLHSLMQVAVSLDRVASGSTAQLELRRGLDDLLFELRHLSSRELLGDGGLERTIRFIWRRCEDLERGLEAAYFGNRRPAAAGPPREAALLVPQ